MSNDDQKMIFAQNLAFYVARSGKQQKEIAQILGFPLQTFNGWCKGVSIPSMDKVQKIADYFRIGKTDLLDKTDYTQNRSTKGVKIPVLGRVAAGIPINAVEEIIDYEELPEEIANTGEYFGLLIKGDSMEPRIKENDVVIVRKQEDADDGDLVIALINGHDAVCKRLKKYQDGIALLSNNPKYDPLYFSQSEIQTMPVTILGKVKELRAKF